MGKSTQSFGCPVSHFKWTEAGVVLASTGDSPNTSTLALTNVEKGSICDPVGFHEIPVDKPTKIDVHRNTIAVASSEGCSFHEFDAKDKTISSLTKTLKGLGNQTALAFSRCGAMVALGGADGHLRVYTYPELTLFGDVPAAHSETITDICFNVDSTRICTVSKERASEESGAAVWSVWDPSCVQYKTSPGGLYLEKWSNVWDRSAFKDLNGYWSGVGYTVDVLYMGFNQVCPKTGQTSALVIQVEAGPLIGWGKRVDYYDAEVVALTVSEDGLRVASASSKGDISVSFTRSLLPILSQKNVVKGPVRCLGLSPCATMLLAKSADSDGLAKVSLPEKGATFPFTLVLVVIAILMYLYTTVMK
ncbi:hypothetical protein CYMTET_38993 [Cymbomonas tetramitiformis]|uniref:Prolactin regulatory element-binding protein n=1 Tax=Cymbomonas tetramitiformis TaxID=36881 RepID=A0AAE0CCB1_9CHLO|nr:hypothetical protein CYMTET_38993 [Cymbomonas tetramitiformis]